MKKRILSILMAAVMIVSLIPVAWAAGETLTFSASETNVKPGDTFQITIVSKKIEGAYSADINIAYDKAVLEVTSISWNTTIPGTAPTTVAEAKTNGFFQKGYVDNTNYEALTIGDDTTLLTASFKVSDDAPAGNTNIVLNKCDFTDEYSITMSGITVNTDKIAITVAGSTPAHEHVWSDAWSKDATHHWHDCTAAGCDAANADKNGYAKHTYDQRVTKEEFKVADSGSCTEPVSYYFSCVCGAKGTETFTDGDALGHKWVKGVADETTLKSPATCEEPAVYYMTCSVCGKHDDPNKTFTKGEALGHTGGTATCKDKAICDLCHQSYGEFAEHTYGDLIVEVPATHLATGVRAHYQCKVCEKLFNENKEETTAEALVIDKIPHDTEMAWKSDDTHHWHECSCGTELDKAAHTFEWVIDKPATEDETGLKHEECVCGAIRNENTVIKKLDHTHKMEKINAVAATCTAEGNNEYYHCTKCDLYFKDAAGTKATTVEAEAIARVPHTAVKHDRVEPTHFAAGNIEYYTCSVCGKYFSDADCTAEITKAETVLAKIEHSFSENWTVSADKHWHECTCGTKADEADHAWGEWTVTKAATETVAGEKQRECSVCHYIEKAEILPLNCRTITVDVDGTTTTVVTGVDGKLATLPEAPTRSGYTFNGWFTEKTGGEKVTTDTVFTKDTTIYAQWTQNAGPKPAGSGTTSGTKTVQSGKTFDAGVGVYVGLSILSLTGSAVVIGKKRKDR